MSILFIEELGIGGTSLGGIKGSLVRCFRWQAVLPVFWIVKGHLQPLPAGFTRCLSPMLEHAGWVNNGVALVGWQAAMPNGGRSGQGT